MRIIAIKPRPVIIIVVGIYAVLGFLAFLTFAFSSAQYFTIPFGIYTPEVHLNLNFNLKRSPDLLANAFFCVALVLSYAMSGFLTAAGATLGFNYVAGKMGGVDAKYFSIIEGDGIASGQPSTVADVPKLPNVSDTPKG
jgi:hypothetical protein